MIPLLETGVMSCRVCGGAFRETFNRLDESFGRCASCGTLNKLITASQYEGLNPTYDPGGYRVLDEAPGKAAFLRSILGQPKGRLLDIGCGMGGYMLAAQSLGMQAQGIEPSAEHSRAGRSLGLDIRTQHFDPSDHPDPFDVVILSHVIEHIYRPAEFMAGIAKVLKPGGTLILVTPNASAFTALATGGKWSMLAPVDHVTMIGPKALSLIAPWASSITWRTSEYVWEAISTLLIALRKIAPRGPATAGRPDRRRPILRALLSAASAPLWAIGKLSRRGGCLVAVIRA